MDVKPCTTKEAPKQVCSEVKNKVTMRPEDSIKDLRSTFQKEHQITFNKRSGSAFSLLTHLYSCNQALLRALQVNIYLLGLLIYQLDLQCL